MENGLKIQEIFKEFEEVNTGGNVFVYRRDFPNKQGKQVMVSIGSDCIVIYKHKGNSQKYASKLEFDLNQNYYWEYADELEEIILEIKNDVIIVRNIAYKNFYHNQIKELKELLSFINEYRN